MIRRFAADRKVQLIVSLGLITFVVSRLVLPPAAATWVVTTLGYWALIGILGYFGYLVFRVFREGWRDSAFRKTGAGLLALVVIIGGVLLAHERYGFKILADEVTLLGTSMGLHYERTATYPVRATDVQGPFQILERRLDKRPMFYPFVVALAHDLTGYRPENAFYVNTVLGFVFLSLVAAIGWRVGRSRWAGALLVLLFGGLPLLAQQMKGGGFELLNLVMLATVVLLGIRYAERRDDLSASALCLAAVLLAYTRYESILMLVPVAGLVAWGWWREQRVVAPWPVLLTPVLLVVPLLQNRVFTLNTNAWELASKPEASSPFGIGYVAGNVVHALVFFFDTTGYQPNSPLFSALGLLALVFFVLWIVRILRAGRDTSPDRVAVALTGLGLLGIGALLMAYFWGQFDDPVIHRLSLPVHLLMALAIVAAGGSVFRSDRWWKAACAVAGVGLVLYSLPVMSRRAYGRTYQPAAQMEWRADFLQRYPARDYLFIDNDAVFWITHHVPATAATQVPQNRAGILFHLRNHTFSDIYVMQHFTIDPATGQWRIRPTDDLGPDFELEPFWERRIASLYLGRISRLKAIRTEGKEVIRAVPLVRPVEPGPANVRAPGAKLDAATDAFVRKWLDQLP